MCDIACMVTRSASDQVLQSYTNIVYKTKFERMIHDTITVSGGQGRFSAMFASYSFLVQHPDLDKLHKKDKSGSKKDDKLSPSISAAIAAEVNAVIKKRAGGKFTVLRRDLKNDPQASRGRAGWLGCTSVH